MPEHYKLWTVYCKYPDYEQYAGDVTDKYCIVARTPQEAEKKTHEILTTTGFYKFCRQQYVKMSVCEYKTQKAFPLLIGSDRNDFTLEARLSNNSQGYAVHFKVTKKS